MAEVRDFGELSPTPWAFQRLTSLNLPADEQIWPLQTFWLKDLTSVTSSIASMSLSGDSRAESRPERIDLFSQLGHASGVVHDHMSRDLTICASGLSSNPGLGLSAGEPVTRHQPLNLSFMINIDRYHKIEVALLAGLDQQRDDMHHDCIRPGSPFELGGPDPNRRVHNSLEIATRERIGKHELGQTRPVQSSLGNHLLTKTVDDRSKRWGAWLDYLTGQHVGVDDDRTAGGKLGGHHALT
jgi:hypothetical protein